MCSRSCRSSSRLWTPYVFPNLVSCLDLGNLIYDPVAVIFDRDIAIFTFGIVVFDLNIAIFGLGIAQLNSQLILLNELTRFEITPPNDRPRLLRSALPHTRCFYAHNEDCNGGVLVSWYLHKVNIDLKILRNSLIKLYSVKVGSTLPIGSYRPWYQPIWSGQAVRNGWWTIGYISSLYSDLVEIGQPEFSSTNYSFPFLFSQRVIC